MGDRSKIEARRALVTRGLETAPRAPSPEGGRRGFCSKRQSEVQVMFEGPGTFICNECVMLFAGEIGKRRSP